MHSHIDQTSENKSQWVSSSESRKRNSDESTYQLKDNRPETAMHRKLHLMANNSPQVSQLRAFQKLANDFTNGQQHFAPSQKGAIQAKSIQPFPRENSVIQLAEIVGVKEDEPHPTQNRVNRAIVDHKIEALQTGRYELSHSVVEGQRAGEDTTFVSDGHHAYVAANLEEEEIEEENAGVGLSDYTWEDVDYADDDEWYEEWLEEEGKVDLDRANAISNANDDGALETAWDELNDWEKTAISDESGLYDDVWEYIEDNDLTNKFRELIGELQEEGTSDNDD